MKRLFAILAILFCSVAVNAQIIITIAGNGTPGFSGDGSLATNAQLGSPQGAFADDSGNVFIADFYNMRIRKVNPAGVITTVAGGGTSGLGDGGQATAAELVTPPGVFTDVSGNMYITDDGNYRIRRVSTSGIITTIVGNGTVGFSGDGGPATTAELWSPWRTCMNSSGYFYIADDGNNGIRMVSPSGIITTIAGIPRAMGYSGDGVAATTTKLFDPKGVCLDGSGNVYIADEGNNRIRKVSPGGIITTIAGNGTPGYSGDGIPATSSELSLPPCVAVDGLGNVYIADRNNNRIRMVNTMGIISTIAGTGLPGYGGDGGPPTAAVLNQPYGVYVDSSGNIYIADSYNERIRKICNPYTPATVSGLPVVCVSASISLSASTPGGRWSAVNNHASVSRDGGVVSGITAGVDTIVYTLNGCTFVTTAFTVTVNPLPFAGSISGADSLCPGATVTLTDTVTGGVWSSTNARATVSGGLVSGITAGLDTISYTVTNSCGGATAIHTITVNAAPDAGTITGSSSVCVGSAIALSDAAASGVWSSVSVGGGIIATVNSMGIVSGIAAGADTIKYSVSNKFCSATAIKIVTVTPLPDAGTITGSSVVCTGSTIILSDHAAGGVWSSSNAKVTVISGVVKGVTTGSATIAYTVTNICSSATATHTVSISPSPDAGSITGPSTVCVGASITLSDTISGGIWSSYGFTTVTGGIATGVFAGIDTIIYTVFNGTCANRAIIPINVSPLPDPGIINGPSDICIGTIITLSDMANGGVWSSSNTSIATVSAGMVTGIIPGISTISYSITNSCGVGYASKVVSIDSLPNAGTINGSANLCKNATFTLYETVANGEWSISNTAIATINSSTGVVNSNSLGTTTVTYTTAPNSGGCVNSTTFMLSVIASPLLVTGNISQVSCYGKNDGSIAATVSGGTGSYQYLWSKGDTVSVINDRSPGTYNLLVKDRTTQCTAGDSFLVTQPDSLFITASVNDDTCKEGSGSISIAVTGGTAPYQYLWSNNAKENNIKGLLGGTYSLSVTDMNNCLQNGSFVVADTCNDIIIHDVITPDGDGINDVWVVEGIQSYSKNTVQIFDKWGNLLYEKENYNNEWGGRGSKGELLPDGTYFYLVKLNATNTTGGKNVFTGAILIKR